MLLKFALKNWMSFREEASFSMVADEDPHSDHTLYDLDIFQAKILPISLFLGSSASGKSNFFKALWFVKALVSQGTASADEIIPVQPFKLDTDGGGGQCSEFSLMFLIEKLIYELSFKLTSRTVLEEKLVLTDSGSEKVLYRRLDKKPNFHESIAHSELLQFAFKTVRDNQLFLTRCGSLNIKEFIKIHEWFNNTLNIVFPDKAYGFCPKIFGKKDPLYSAMNTLLRRLDTGINRFGMEKYAPQKTAPEELTERSKSYDGGFFPFKADSNLSVNAIDDGNLVLNELKTYHLKNDGSEVSFNLSEESAGTRKLLDLLPVILLLTDKDPARIYVIDEFDRSLHSLLTCELIDIFLTSCSPESKNQLIFSAQDTCLMERQLLRHDEIWLTQRDKTGNSSLYSVNDFEEAKSDKNIRSSYLLGRLGGIPKI
jgi:AAA15 family ATPase/GTPase